MFGVLSMVVLSMVWLERKALGRLQLRYGPTRTGLFGLMQPIADAVKLIIKEDIIPDDSEKAIFWIAPVIVVVSAFVIWVTIPGGDNVVIRHLPLGLFYIIAFAVIGILGLVLAGWGSANKYGIMGGLRSAAQLISYEIPVVLVAAAVAILAQSLDMREIVAQQSAYPYLLVLPLGFVVFFIAGLAEVGRTPFDIYHAESEVVGRPVCGVQRRPLVGVLPCRIHQHLRHRRADDAAVPGRLGRPGPARRGVVPVQDLRRGAGGVLGAGNLPAVSALTS